MIGKLRHFNVKTLCISSVFIQQKEYTRHEVSTHWALDKLNQVKCVILWTNHSTAVTHYLCITIELERREASTTHLDSEPRNPLN